MCVVIIDNGRSDYLNQVNNILCFRFFFRGAFESRATEINDEMKVVAVNAFRQIAKQSVSETVAGVSVTSEVAQIELAENYMQ